MKTSRVTPKTAGIESTAKTTSVASMTTSTGEQRASPALAVLAHEEVRALVVGGRRDEPAEQLAATGFRSGCELLVAADQELEAGDDQEDPEDVGHPVERREQRGADRDEDAARDQRAQDPPEQHPVLQVRGHREEREGRQEDEQVVDGERLLDQPGLEELQRPIRAAGR